MSTPLLVGVALALGVAMFGVRLGFDRERSFYSVMLIVVASYYVLFAAMGGGPGTLWREMVVAAIFVAMAVRGTAATPWLLTAGLAAHGLLDAVHGALIANPGVPAWWPPFCGAYDLAAAACHGWLTWLRTASPRASQADLPWSR